VSDFAKNLVLAVVAAVGPAVGQAMVDAANHKRAEAKASRERWEALIAEARAQRVKAP
jgi:hypothetical protein